MRIEMNIRLDVRGARNSIRDCEIRANQALDFIGRNIGYYKARRFDHQAERDDGTLEYQQSILVVVDIDAMSLSFADDINELCRLLQQDCIAINQQGTTSGWVLGPHPERYGKFNFEKFVPV